MDENILADIDAESSCYESEGFRLEYRVKGHPWTPYCTGQEAAVRAAKTELEDVTSDSVKWRIVKVYHKEEVVEE